MGFDYSKFFPYDEIRDLQVSAIDQVLAAFDANKRFVIVEGGTGVGKSAIGVTVARYLDSGITIDAERYKCGAYFTTTQKLLQDQYVADFGISGGKMCSIKSATNYKCKFHKGNSCSESLALLRTADRGGSFFKTCTKSCRYKQAKKEFLDSVESVTNFPYMLTEANYSGKMVPRELLVVDEAHNAESELSKFVEVTVSERFCKQMLSINWPGKPTQFQAFKWIRDVYFPKIKRQRDHVEKMIERFTDLEKTMKEFGKIAREFDLLRGHCSRLETFVGVYDSNNWVFENVMAFGKSKRKMTFRAIDIAPFAETYLFRLGQRVLLMSATILDKDAFCRSLGIKAPEAEFISLPSPFPFENRPIFGVGVGSMNKSNIESTLPKIVQAVRKILDQHPDEKGIIHTHTFRIARALKYGIKGRRLLMHTSEDREEVLRMHLESPEPTVLLSPSMTEGVDLKGDLSRFQVVCKVPYPYYGDPLVRKRMNKWEWWYPLQTAKTLIQASGRSIRDAEDYAVTYILDADWESFFSRSSPFFPADFKERLQ
jgi:ATP-dependent DNA helicase DinG